MEPDFEKKEPQFKEESISEIEKYSYPISPAQQEEDKEQKGFSQHQEQQPEPPQSKPENVGRNNRFENQH